MKLSHTRYGGKLIGYVHHDPPPFCVELAAIGLSIRQSPNLDPVFHGITHTLLGASADGLDLVLRHEGLEAKHHTTVAGLRIDTCTVQKMQLVRAA